MPTKRIALVVGARPNWMKAVPVWNELKKNSNTFLVYTGQHYSENLFDIFLKELNIVKEEIDELSDYPTSSEPYQSLSWMIEHLGNYFKEKEIQIVVVFGDIHSTLAGALAASMLSLPIVHVESGLRCWDESMPEERNRSIVDKLSTILCTTEPSAMDNLYQEGLLEKAIYTGNSMMDTLDYFLQEAILSKKYKYFNVEPKKYIMVTIHRQNNVNSKERLTNIIDSLNTLHHTKNIKLLFPIHPRTKEALHQYNINTNHLDIIDPIGYYDMIHLVYYSHCVITDSGGLQEETTYIGIPCITLRPNTERPITVTNGSNIIINPKEKCLTERLLHAYENIKEQDIHKLSEVKEIMGNGKAGQKIAEVILSI